MVVQGGIVLWAPFPPQRRPYTTRPHQKPSFSRSNSNPSAPSLLSHRRLKPGVDWPATHIAPKDGLRPVSDQRAAGQKNVRSDTRGRIDAKLASDMHRLLPSEPVPRFSSNGRCDGWCSCGLAHSLNASAGKGICASSSLRATLRACARFLEPFVLVRRSKKDRR